MEYNLEVLSRRDSSIKGVLDTAGHVVLYQFNELEQSWDRKQVEGSLFVVVRSEAPLHQFVVLNRLSSNNLVENVTADFQMELTEQFLLYRNEKQEINGIWFYNTAEREAIFKLLNSLASSYNPADANAPETAPAPAAEAPDPVPPANLTPSAACPSVEQFFHMMQSSVSTATVPPMPATATASAPEAALQAAPVAAPPAPAAPTKAKAAPVSDHQALKQKLKAQLTALLDNDQFMDLLVSEYLQQRSGRPAPTKSNSRPVQQHPPGLTADGSAAGADVPPDLIALLQTQMAQL